MIAPRAAHGALALGLLTALAGCETTAGKSARLAAQAQATVNESGLRVTAIARDVTVRERAVVSDANGTAVVVTLRATAPKPLADVPIAIDVRDAGGTSLFRNDQPGADPALVSAPLLAPRRDVSWVHDQVQASGGRPAGVEVRVGRPRGEPPPRPPRMSVGRLTIAADGAGGTEGRGRLTNHTSQTQRAVTVYAVARRGAKVVAAGRAVVDRVRAGRSAPFAIYFIGDPRGAHVALSAAPPATRGGR